MDKKGIILVLLYFIEFSVSVLTVLFSSLVKGYFIPLVILGVLAFAVFLFISVDEITGSKRLRVIEKVLWIAAMVMIFNLTGIFYMIVRRRWVL